MRRALAVAALALALAGCGASHDAYFGSTRAPQGQVFTFNNGTEPEMLDPNLMAGQPDGRIARMLFEGLTVTDPKTQLPAPGVAHSWDITPDGLTYTFHLRGDARWSDGHPVTAGDFAYGWWRTLSPRLAARNAGLMTPIVNADAYNKGETADSTQVGFAAVDDTTFVVRLTHPTPYFLSLCSFYIFMPAPRWCIERWGDAWTRPEHIVSNGPFVMRAWRQGDRIVAERNPRYWDRAKVRLDRIVALAVEDLSTSVNLYKAGTIDWCPSGFLPTQYVPYVRHHRDYTDALFQATYYYSINCTQPPFDNVYVRRALNEALDRESLCRDLLRGVYPPYGRFVPQGYPGYVSPPAVRFDVTQARADLARAGFPDGKGFPRLEILFNTSENHRRLAEAVQAMWKKNLGIDVRLSNQEWGSYLQACTGLHYQVARRSWIGDYLDPTTFLNAMRTGDGNNRTGWSNPRYDALLDRAAHEPDAATRSALLTQCEDILLRDAPLIPIYHYTTTEFIKPYVRGIYPSALDFHLLKEVWIDHDWRAHTDSTHAEAASR